MVEGDAFTVVLTIKGTLTKDLKDLLSQTYPDKTFVDAIHICLTEELNRGLLGRLCEESTVSFTNIKQACDIT